MDTDSILTEAHNNGISKVKIDDVTFRVLYDKREKEYTVNKLEDESWSFDNSKSQVDSFLEEENPKHLNKFKNFNN